MLNLYGGILNLYGQHMTKISAFNQKKSTQKAFHDNASNKFLRAYKHLLQDLNHILLDYPLSEPHRVLFLAQLSLGNVQISYDVF